jgi:UDP-2-acetamido-2-deoxy-ribo-hexuluronate aminotransferase
VDDGNASVWAQYTIRSKKRDELQKKMRSAGVPSMIHYPVPLNMQPAVSDKDADLPVGDRLSREVISLPMHPYLTEGDVMQVVEALIK